MVVCRPPVAHDSRRLSAVGSAAAGGGFGLEELDITDPAAGGEVPLGAPPDADPIRDIAVGKDAVLRMPLYGHRGAPAADLCRREVAPLLARVLAGESAAVIAYGQTGGGVGGRRAGAEEALLPLLPGMGSPAC